MKQIHYHSKSSEPSLGAWTESNKLITMDNITNSPKGEVVGVTGVKTDLPDSFDVNYKSKLLTVVFEGEVYFFNLTEGDVGDFWFSLTDRFGISWDINFYQESEEEVPIVGIYELNWVNEKNWYETGKAYAVITLHTTEGDPRLYFYTDTAKV